MFARIRLVEVQSKQDQNQAAREISVTDLCNMARVGPLRLRQSPRALRWQAILPWSSFAWRWSLCGRPHGPATALRNFSLFRIQSGTR